MPSQLKSRDELPWLYYPRSNSVRVLNSHLGGGGSLAVNGKMPIAAWVPSLDTAGNGTTTLTDLIGSNNGTLTNMDAATDWVSDTGAGGVRALDFDGTNDYVDFTTYPDLNGISEFSVAFWIYARRIRTDDGIWCARGTNANLLTFSSSTQMRFRLVTSGGLQLPTITFNVTDTWKHVIFTWKSGGNYTAYLDGSSVLSASAATGTVTQDAGWDLGRDQLGGTRYLDGRIDDFRVFNQQLDASDATYLYNSGSGRGRTS